MRNLLLQLEDFLRESVDLRVLFIDFFCQRFKLRQFERFGGFRRRRLGWSRRKQGETRKERCKESNSQLHRAKLCHQLLCLASMWESNGNIGGSLPFQFLPLNFFMPERIQKPVDPVPWGPKQGDDGGPRSPDVSRPDTKDLLKKMRKVDPNQSKRYRQRTGQ